MRVRRFESVPAVENVFYAFVGWELPGLRGPGCGEGASIDVGELAVVGGFGEVEGW